MEPISVTVDLGDTAERPCHVDHPAVKKEFPFWSPGLTESERRALRIGNLQSPPYPSQENGDSVQREDSHYRTLVDLPDWALANTGRITLLPRAISGAKRSHYRNATEIFEALDFLAGPYRDRRLNKLSEKAYEKTLLQMQSKGFHVTRSVDPSVAGRERSAYFVTFAGHKRFMSWHVGKGRARNAQFCLRIYFFWDDHCKRVVVGSLPAHLDNSLS
jgi:hypothetical protein